MLASWMMARQGRFTRPAKGQDEHFSYAYHFDANLFAVFLRTTALKRGVRRTEGRIVEVMRRADGAVDQLKLADGRAVAGDLFIDCTGFVSLLLGRALEEPWVDFSHWLPMDRAWAVPSAPSGSAITPFTRSTALEAGWAWRIPLVDRVGNGHVFSTRYIDEDRARNCSNSWMVRPWPSRGCCVSPRVTASVSGSTMWSPWAWRPASWNRLNRPASC